MLAWVLVLDTKGLLYGIMCLEHPIVSADICPVWTRGAVPMKHALDFLIARR